MNVMNKIKSLEKQVDALTEQRDLYKCKLDEVSKENDRLKRDKILNEGLISLTMAAHDEYKESIKEIESLKIEYKLAINEARKINTEYERKYKNLLKELGFKG